MNPQPLPLTPAERTALTITAVSTIGFGIYGFAAGAHSTVGYLFSVVALSVLVVRLRRAPIPGPLALSLAVLSAAHLAGGLVQVGDGVLYNAHWWTEVFQYDHLVHSSASFAATLAVWTLLRSATAGTQTGLPVLACMLGGLGLGAANETVEFLVTLVDSGSAVGGYQNTGWDLVSNLLGASAAAFVIARMTPSRSPLMATTVELAPVASRRPVPAGSASR